MLIDAKLKPGKTIHKTELIGRSTLRRISALDSSTVKEEEEEEEGE